jgi:hypothetical protein
MLLIIILFAVGVIQTAGQRFMSRFVSSWLVVRLMFGSGERGEERDDVWKMH